ncbi:MAG: C_GCAxxG_C_C family protein [Clostridia bacterium]|nr:C_GCAxxG_C_C family protein [Clostridia bacterium]
MKIDPEARAEKALALFLGGYNCSQAVFCAYADLLCLDDRAAFALSSSFGGGIGRMRMICGTLSGAFMVLGYLYGRYEPGDNGKKAELYARVREIADRFKKERGSVVCAELLAAGGVDPNPGGAPEARDPAFYKKRKTCVVSVALSARILGEYIVNHPVNGGNEQ